jgi:hypothetical protein
MKEADFESNFRFSNGRELPASGERFQRTFQGVRDLNCCKFESETWLHGDSSTENATHHG